MIKTIHFFNEWCLEKRGRWAGNVLLFCASVLLHGINQAVAAYRRYGKWGLIIVKISIIKKEKTCR